MKVMHSYEIRLGSKVAHTRAHSVRQAVKHVVDSRAITGTAWHWLGTHETEGYYGPLSIVRLPTRQKELF